MFPFCPCVSRITCWKKAWPGWTLSQLEKPSTGCRHSSPSFHLVTSHQRRLVRWHLKKDSMELTWTRAADSFRDMLVNKMCGSCEGAGTVTIAWSLSKVKTLLIRISSGTSMHQVYLWCNTDNECSYFYYIVHDIKLGVKCHVMWLWW